MAFSKNEIAARETRLREAIRRFVRSDQRVLDFEALLLAGATAFRQGIALDYETVHRIIAEVLDEKTTLQAAE